jgi:excisionase family DNA binding protein
MSERKENFPRKFLTVPDVAEELNVSVRKVWTVIEDRLLKTHKFGHSRRISREDLNDYIAKSRE